MQTGSTRSSDQTENNNPGRIPGRTTTTAAPAELAIKPFSLLAAVTGIGNPDKYFYRLAFFSIFFHCVAQAGWGQAKSAAARGDACVQLSSCPSRSPVTKCAKRAEG